jgi:hypothetical protein
VTEPEGHHPVKAQKRENDLRGRDSCSLVKIQRKLLGIFIALSLKPTTAGIVQWSPWEMKLPGAGRSFAWRSQNYMVDICTCSIVKLYPIPIFDIGAATQQLYSVTPRGGEDD